MRKPRDIQAELKALEDKAAALKAEHRARLTELLDKTGAADLEPELLAGLILDGIGKARADAAAAAAWRERGAAFFRPPARRRGGPAAASAPEPAPAAAPAG